MRKTFKLFCLVFVCSLFVIEAQEEVQTEEPQAKDSKLVKTFDVPEARQGIGVDENYFYAVDNRSITKYDKGTGELVDKWEGPEDGPMIHLDSAVVMDGRIYAAHSNYDISPMTSSIEVWDAETMEHIDSYSFGIEYGSLTWLDRHDGFWWATFANYNNYFAVNGDVAYGNNRWTTMVKLDDDFQKLEAWVFPDGIVERFEDMSNSGGSWGPDGRLYVSGHDLPEVYVMELPDIGSVLEWVGTVNLDIAGQGIAWDRSEPGILYGIVRADRRVSVNDLSEVLMTDEPQSEATSDSVLEDDASSTQ
jgi:hypothetical protein